MLTGAGTIEVTLVASAGFCILVLVACSRCARAPAGGDHAPDLPQGRGEITEDALLFSIPLDSYGETACGST
jgi:hypothetical protein